jgi:steroid delta-isomerase-like uncharacterized protein
MKKTFPGLAVVAIATVLAAGCCGECKDVEANKALVREAFDALVAGEYDRAGEFFAEDYVRHSQSTEVTEMRSLEEFVQFLQADKASFPDSTGHLDMLVAEGDLVAIWGRWEGTQTGSMGPFPPSGKRMELDMAGVHRIENGKIVETWVTWDNLAALKQLGHFPPGTEEKSEEPEESAGP